MQRSMTGRQCSYITRRLSRIQEEPSRGYLISNFVDLFWSISRILGWWLMKVLNGKHLQKKMIYKLFNLNIFTTTIMHLKASRLIFWLVGLWSPNYIFLQKPRFIWKYIIIIIIIINSSSSGSSSSRNSGRSNCSSSIPALIFDTISSAVTNST